MKVKDIKKKVAAKIGKAKKKVAAKCGRRGCAAKVVAALALSLVLVGCATSDNTQPAKSATMNNTFEDCIIVVASKTTISNRVVQAEATEESAGLEMFTITQSLETGGNDATTQTTTQTPTNTTDTDAALDVPVNKMNSGTSAAGGAAERLLGAGADWLSGKLNGGSTAAAATTQSAASGDCKDGSCTYNGGSCSGGSCSTGACTDGSCSP